MKVLRVGLLVIATVVAMTFGALVASADDFDPGSGSGGGDSGGGWYGGGAGGGGGTGGDYCSTC